MEAPKPLIFDYFANMFNSEGYASELAFLRKIQIKVAPAINDGLHTPFTAEDVKKAAFIIGDFKAPGPDGLHDMFYKKN